MGRHGENIHLRSDGRWEARIPAPHRRDGKKRYKSLYGRSYQEVKQRRDTYLMNGGVPQLPNHAPPRSGAPEPTFAQAAERWLEAKRPQVKESTYIHYAHQTEKHLLPELGPLPLGEIDTRRLETFLTDKRESGRLADHAPLSANSVADIKVILVQILKYAKSHGMIEAVPDCPTTPCIRPQISVLSVEEQEQLVQYVLKHESPFTLGVLISLYAGLRIGEVCALQWGDFNFTSGTVTVRKTVMRIYDADQTGPARTKVMIDSPKTLSSLRTIPLADGLARYFEARSSENEAFVVTGTKKFMEPRVCLDRYKRLLRRAGLPDYHFHLLRHTFATRCVERGVDLKSLSEIMGHANVSVTMQRYVHPSMAAKKEQINKLTNPAFRGRDSWSK